MSKNRKNTAPDAEIVTDDKTATIADTAGAEPNVDAELAALLANVAEPEVVDPVESAFVANSDVDLEAVESELIVRDMKAESYGTQEAPTEAPPIAAANDETSTSTAVAKPATKRVSTAGKAPSEVIKSWGDEPLAKAAMLVSGDTGTAEEISAMLGTIDKLAKKVGEKAINLLKHRMKPASLQGYTRSGLELLVAKGEITSKDLYTAFRAKYTEGTSRSQSNQLMQLFPALKIAERTSRTSLKLNAGSEIVREFQAATGS